MVVAQELQLQGPPLSAQGQARAELGKQMEPFEKNASDAYDPERNPNGIISLAVAENTILHEELASYFGNSLRLTCSDFMYGSLKGDLRLRNTLSNFFNIYFKPSKSVAPDHIVMGAGLVSLVAHLVGVVANRGDGILVAKPYYYGWDIEFSVLHGVVPVGVSVPFSDMFTPAELSHFETTLQESNKRGTKIKAVFLCNPNNPFGRTYPKEVIIEYCKFCEKHNLHLISDEIYALSTFSSRDIPKPQPFISALSLDLGAYDVNPSRLHVLYGMSKDFNCNGFRIGALVSQHNPSVLRSITAIAFLFVVSSPASALWTALLSDPTSLSYFLNTNKFKLREGYEHLTSWLKFHNISYIPSCAGHFLLADMRPILLDIPRYGTVFSIEEGQDMGEREAALARYLSSRGVQVREGSMCHMESGWFRITFTVRRDFLDVGLARIEDAMGWERWPELELPSIQRDVVKMIRTARCSTAKNPRPISREILEV